MLTVMVAVAVAAGDVDVDAVCSVQRS